MKPLLLVRHGEAVDGAPGGDDHRWLTDHGRTVTRAVASRLVGLVRPATVWTSPLVRAVQTAEIVTSALAPAPAVTVLRELASGDLAGVAQHVRATGDAWPLCLVGHEPTLSALVLHLLGAKGPPWHGFDRSDACCLALDGDHARFAWRLRARDLTVVNDLSPPRG